MNSEDWLSNFSIVDIKKIQEKEFLDKIPLYNEKIGKELIYKYDMKHSCVKNILDASGNIDKMKEIYETYLSERKKFFDYISSYL